ncbi:MAG: YqgE/AlgH family protein [Verrucomicrobiia bacterium]
METARIPPLQYRLLVAHPALRDPHFRHTVIYLLEHDPKEGSLGLVLNRPMDCFAAELLPDHQSTPFLSAIPVFWGGPVGANQLTFAAIEPKTSGQVRFVYRLPLEEVESYILKRNSSVRAYVGYAGWSGGQIEAEIQERSWVVQSANSELLLDPERPQGETLWRTIISSLGPLFRLEAGAPENPSLN